MKGVLFLLAGLGLGLLLGLLVFYGGPTAGKPAAGVERRLPPTVGSALADFSLTQLNGERIALSDLRGRPVVINFWATWCPPCREEMPLLEQTAQTYADQLVVIGIDYGEDAQTVAAYVQEIGIHFPIALDEDGQVSERYYVRSFPTTFFVDAEGVLRAQHLGALTDKLMVTYLQTVGVETVATTQ
jgi:thiol-disulfide isomerase/thioredoxin